MRKLLFAVSCSLILAGCGNPFSAEGSSTVEAEHRPGFESRKLPLARGTEMVSSSAQGVLSQNSRFKLQGTLSSPSSQVYSVSTTRGYKLYSNIQGELISQ